MLKMSKSIVPNKVWDFEYWNLFWISDLVLRISDIGHCLA